MEEVNRSEDLARRAAELAARAEELVRHARDAGEVDEELARLEAELGRLDEEQGRLDQELGDYVHPPEEAEPVRDPGEGFTFRLGDLGERIADIVNIALSSVKLGAADIVEREISVGERVPVSVDSFAGSITVVPGSDDKVHVVAERRALDERDLEGITVEVDRRDDGVHIAARSASARRGRHWVQLTVSVPPGSPSRLRTRGGSVRIDGIGAEVRAQTSGGSIRIAGAVGHADAETSGGSIRIDDQDGPVTAKTVGGSIKLGGHLPGVDAATIGGTIKIDGVDGPVVASTKGGSISVIGRLAGMCSLDTAGGSISIGLEVGSRITVDASGSGGASADIEGLESHGNRISGEVEGGGDGRLVARTVAGSIRIRRA